MHHCQVDLSQCPGIISLPAQHLSYLLPPLPGVPEVAQHCRTFVALCYKNSPRVLEGGDLGDGGSLGSECPLRPLPGILLRQATPIPLHYPYAECCCQVPDFKGLLWHKHVALGEPGVGAVNLLQDHNYIPHVVVRKVNPEVGPTWRPSEAPFCQAPEPR